MHADKKELMKKTAADLRVLADDMEALANGPDDGLDDEPTLDDHGYPVDMDPAERKAIEENEYKEGLEAVVESNKVEEPVKISLEDIRQVLIEKKRAGFIKEVKALITEYKVDRISALDEDLYGEFIVKAKAIGEAA